MSLFRRGAPEQRSFETEALFALRGRNSTAGQVVTDETSSRLMAVWRCKHLIADIVSGLPIDQFTERGGPRKRVAKSEIVASPSEMVFAEEWRYQLLLDAASYGNGLAFTTKFGPSGWPVRSETVSWSDVQVRQERGAFSPPEYRINGELVDTARVMHLRAFGPRAGTVLGMSPIAYARETIGLGLAVREFGSNWYESGGHPTSLLSTAQPINDDQALAAKEKFRSATRGDHIAVLGNGWDLKSVQVAPDDALFLAATAATSVDICGYYGIPPELIGYAPQGKGSITYANREQRAIDVLVFTLQWWISRMERLISAQLPNGQFTKINVDAFLRSDAATRWKIHDTAVRLGAMSIDEVRDLEDEGPLPDGTGNRYVWPPGSASTTADTPPAPAGGTDGTP